MNTTIKQTPIYHIAREAGASFGEEAGWRVVLGFGQDEAGLEAARRGVALADCSARGKVLVEGDAAMGVIQGAWDVTELDVGRGTPIGGGHAYRLRDDRYFLSVVVDAVAETVRVAQAQAETVDGLAAVTDVTHGRGELWLIGPAARTLLSRLCGLDLHPGVFPNHTARESSVAKTKQLIIRRDVGRLPAFALIGGRSLAAYLWKTALEAGRDLQLAPVGQAALSQLRQEGA
ncbi:MAG TPA: sarcosine oxidase subunit gamma family protein [Candidatus Sulfomarinibacteraceae bacterium]|nr:sarcosine oxidase subunit gamma family protein [Candidatus Sulfomarinibacteraceae bacterium]